MNKKNLFFILTIIVTSLTSSMASGILEMDGDTIRILKKLNRKFDVVAHIIVNDTNGSSLDTARFASELASLNNGFRPVAVSFTLCDYRLINYHDDEDERELLDSLRNYNYLMERFLVTDRINIFLVQNLTAITGTTCGFTTGNMATPDSAAIFIKCLEPGTLLHEFGHYFGLLDTYNGSGTELADGSNCATQGDRICDTPADPYTPGADLKEYVTAGCNFQFRGKDAKNSFYLPDVSNPMSAYTFCRCQQFSMGQYERIVKFGLQKADIW